MKFFKSEFATHFVVVAIGCAVIPAHAVTPAAPANDTYLCPLVSPAVQLTVNSGYQINSAAAPTTAIAATDTLAPGVALVG